MTLSLSVVVCRCLSLPVSQVSSFARACRPGAGQLPAIAFALLSFHCRPPSSFAPSEKALDAVLAPTHSATSATISVVIPVLNEQQLVAGAIHRLLQLARGSASEQPQPTASIIEVILVDGGSEDDTCSNVQRCIDERDDDESPRLLLTTSPRGRAAQMNRGAELATGDVLLFLHVDCQLPQGAAAGLMQALRDGYRCGSFRHRIDAPQSLYRCIEWGDAVRQRWLQMPYGDQALFVERELFHQVGGYPAVPLMEDVRLVRQLRRRERLAVVNDCAITDARRWKRRGVVRQFLLNQFVLLAERIGVPLEQLAKLYYR